MAVIPNRRGVVNVTGFSGQASQFVKGFLILATLLFIITSFSYFSVLI